MPSSVPTTVPGAVARLVRLRVGPWRCRRAHFAGFLHRRVRCAHRRRHDGPHAYRSLDEVVSWPASGD